LKLEVLLERIAVPLCHLLRVQMADSVGWALARLCEDAGHIGPDFDPTHKAIARALGAAEEDVREAVAALQAGEAVLAARVLPLLVYLGDRAATIESLGELSAELILQRVTEAMTTADFHEPSNLEGLLLGAEGYLQVRDRLELDFAAPR